MRPARHRLVANPTGAFRSIHLLPTNQTNEPTNHSERNHHRPVETATGGDLGLLMEALCLIFAES
jgi:hypothetical protein